MLASEQPASADTWAESLQLSPVHVSSFLADCIRVAVRARTEGGLFSRISSLHKHGCKRAVTLRIGGSGTHYFFIVLFFLVWTSKKLMKNYETEKITKTLKQYT